MSKTNEVKNITVDKNTWDILCDVSDELETGPKEDGPENGDELTGLYELKAIVRRVIAQSRYYERKAKRKEQLRHNLLI